MQSRAAVATAHASKYLQQPCKHWSHRLEVRHDRQAGHITFGEGDTLELSAAPDALLLMVKAGDEKRIEELEQVVADHLERFAFRETLAFDWKREPAAPR